MSQTKKENRGIIKDKMTEAMKNLPDIKGAKSLFPMSEYGLANSVIERAKLDYQTMMNFIKKGHRITEVVYDGKSCNYEFKDIDNFFNSSNMYTTAYDLNFKYMFRQIKSEFGDYLPYYYVEKYINKDECYIIGDFFKKHNISLKPNKKTYDIYSNGKKTEFTEVYDVLATFEKTMVSKLKKVALSYNIEDIPKTANDWFLNIVRKDLQPVFTDENYKDDIAIVMLIAMKNRTNRFAHLNKVYESMYLKKGRRTR